ncbi:OLC1v1013029C1 [Oldenlandia corymbosa var. corymbosa]|uniref:OLC1v1013029C1 n=1 Tax=Oldenlandia corymbosa var. corymbosa TaxID=529605 RepID=A0AAV1E0T6_OLDCO|nr:OLC1v1013029C1 [Oldenlandia corymbosa var. corymbosa]
MTLVDLNTDSLISNEIYDASVEMVSLIDTPRAKPSLSCVYDMVNELLTIEDLSSKNIELPNDCLDWNHVDANLVTSLNSLRSSNASCLVTFDPGRLLCLNSLMAEMDFAEWGTRVCLDLTVDCTSVNSSTGIQLNLCDEDPEVGKTSHFVDQLLCKAWVRNATCFKGGTTVGKACVGVVTLLDEGNFVWWIAWFSLEIATQLLELIEFWASIVENGHLQFSWVRWS